MANNRIYLTHRPTGKSVYLGSRSADPQWVGPPDDVKERIEKLFEFVEGDYESGDDFCITLEDASGARMAMEEHRDDFPIDCSIEILKPEVKEVCPICEGQGEYSPLCKACEGQGFLGAAEQICQYCEGMGCLPVEECPKCKETE